MTDLEEKEYVLTNTKNQIYAAVVANLVLLAHGSVAGWLSPALSVLLSAEETPLTTGPLSNHEVSWLGGISSLGSIVGTFIFGFLASYLGCKRAMSYLALPSISFWLLVFFGDTLHHLLTGRFIMGLTAGGIQSGIIIFISEISNNNMRGRLGSITPLARNVGVLLSYIVGATVPYCIIPAIFILLPVLYLVLLYLLPNTPQYHIQKQNLQGAEKSLIFYKGCNGKSKSEIFALQVEFEKLKSVNDTISMDKKLKLDDFYNRDAFRGFIVCITMSWFLLMTGCFTFINYALIIFQESNTTLDPHVAAIILAIVQIFGGLISTSIGDTLGRKTILIISLVGSAVGLFSMAVYMYFSENGWNMGDYRILPVVFLAFVIFISNAGIVPLSNVCAVENLPPNIRTYGMNFYTIWYNFVAFLGDKYFPILLGIIQLYGCMLIFAINCVLGTIFVIFFMRETKGRSLNFTESDSTSNIVKN